ncbi:MAG: hypothetical protein KJO40_10870 [Deltaproteobacteria bacterium]|nr:hypothetical protein [Deltaproteobacteria bacterium]NND30742.1 hypothetical protein [Myxococcales bacterium]MBT8463454.1 hypothetical protein [Deltaproteobacteria bacterium]MBT8483797.1 hypothetical protein [Deltaproteobacteria bacterium]NNK09047.1 hypothetical protein [Myxococcales bacterium]
MFLFVAAQSFEEDNGDAAEWDVVAPQVGDEALGRKEAGLAAFPEWLVLRPSYPDALTPSGS